ncbi:MAG: B12-binding domain-containing radical SAM protein [Ignavibacteriaceae bacterium]
MKILLVYPETPFTFWSFKKALNFISKKSVEPPLGLITIAGMLPKEWELKLIDMNVSKLKDSDITWADYVFLSGMSIQVKSFREVIRKCNVLGTKVVAGGPLITTLPDSFQGIDHLVLNEAEITLTQFLEDLKMGSPKHIYKSDQFPDLSLAGIPRWDLLDMGKYASMSIQYSRGCPYDCEFCSITVLNGRKPRTKSTEQFLKELDVLYNLGWRSDISIVDDNFIGNKRKIKTNLLPALIEWQREKNYPYSFITEVSINLADDDGLIDLMSKAGFYSIFVGIETPNDESLVECGKSQNLKRSMVDSVNKLIKRGFVVSGGFIIGFDNDPPNIFQKQINLIQESGIVSAMVGLLNAPVGTKLHKRLKEEQRLVEEFTGNNMDGSINFIPRMNYSELLNGYAQVVKTIYSQSEYFNRLKVFLKNYNLPVWKPQRINSNEIKAFIKILWKLGVVEKGKKYFWKLLFLSILKYPRKFTVAMTFAVYGFHFRKVVETI